MNGGMTTRQHDQLRQLARARALAASGGGRAARLRAGLSLRDLADPIEVDASTLWRWEQGITRPSPDAARRWGAALAAIEDEVGK